MSAVHTKMDEFCAVLVSYGSASSPEEELQAVLATGHLTPAMQHFLSSILGPCLRLLAGRPLPSVMRWGVRHPREIAALPLHTLCNT